VVAALLFASALRGQMVDGTLSESVSHAPIPGVVFMLLGKERYEAVADEAMFTRRKAPPGKGGTVMLNLKITLWPQ
jgi:hypothetical protein